MFQARQYKYLCGNRDMCFPVFSPLHVLQSGLVSLCTYSSKLHKTDTKTVFDDNSVTTVLSIWTKPQLHVSKAVVLK